MLQNSLTCILFHVKEIIISLPPHVLYCWVFCGFFNFGVFFSFFLFNLNQVHVLIICLKIVYITVSD